MVLVGQRMLFFKIKVYWRLWRTRAYTDVFNLMLINKDRGHMLSDSELRVSSPLAACAG